MKKIILTIILLVSSISTQVSASELEYRTGLKTEYIEESDAKLEQALTQKISSLGVLPSRLDYSKSPHLPPAGKQYENSCVGWAVGYYLRTYQEGKDIGWKIKSDDNYYGDKVFSPSFIYNQINGGVDGGATLQDAGNLIKSIGAATLKDFPYVPKDYKSKPDEHALDKAKNHRIKDWYVLYTRKDAKVDIIRKSREYLNTGDLFTIGIYVGPNWNEPYKDEKDNSIIIKKGNNLEGHAVTVVGYDDEIITPDGVGAFKIINSWGKDWGDDGFSYISYEAFANNTISGVVYTDILNTQVLEERPDDSLYESIYEGEIKKVENTKEWRVKFNKPVDSSTIDSISIFKINGEVHRVDTENVISADSRSEVILKHDEPFELGRYVIYVDDVKSIENEQHLNKKIKMEFIVE